MNMQYFKKEQIKSEINITPFTDVILVLLIIFMVTTPLIIQSGIKINLPKAKQGDSQAEKQTTVTIDRNGEVFLNDQKLEMTDLKNNLQTFAKDQDENSIIIRADQDTKYSFVIQVLDIAKQAGIGKISLIVEKINN